MLLVVIELVISVYVVAYKVCGARPRECVASLCRPQFCPGGWLLREANGVLFFVAFAPIAAHYATVLSTLSAVRASCVTRRRSEFVARRTTAKLSQRL